MNLKSNELYLKRCKEYFKDNYDLFLKELNNDPIKSFYINKLKGEDVLKDVDLDYSPSSINPLAFYYNNESISHSIAYNLGLVYPQGIESSLSSHLFNGTNINIIVDLCSAPGGKAINFINKYKDAFLISNDINYNRQLLTSSNFERLGIDNALLCSINPSILSSKLKGIADLVILDAPCSGEGMARKTDEIFSSYSDNEIKKLSDIQTSLLEDAYNIMNNDSYLVYSTCAYSFEEDEEQVKSFLNKHQDISLIDIDIDGNMSTLKGTVKLSFINKTEGQFISIFHKSGNKKPLNIPLLKNIKNKIVDDFIKNNLIIDEYYLYLINDNYYLSLKPLYDFKINIIKEGIYIGNVVKNRFVPSHFMYRANSLINKYKYEYELNDEEYQSYIKGLELKVNNLNNEYYHLVYKGYSVGFGKVSNNILKNKYPKGLRK